MDHVVCATCNAELTEPALMAIRPACPHCGSTDRTVSVIRQPQVVMGEMLSDAGGSSSMVGTVNDSAQLSDAIVVKVGSTGLAARMAEYARAHDVYWRVEIRWTELDGDISMLEIVDPETGEITDTVLGNDAETMAFESLDPGLLLPPWYTAPPEDE